MVDAALPNLIDDLAVAQGGTYLALSKVGIQFEGDLTTATWEGEIRNNYRESDGTLLGVFEFLPPTYDAELDITTVYPIISAATTEILAGTTWKTGRTPSVRNCYVWDIEGTKDGVVYKKFPAFMAVLSEVTGGTDAPPVLPPDSTFLVSANNLSDIDNAETARLNLGIVAGIKPDWNVDPAEPAGILNRPTLGTAAVTDATDYATAAQGALADTALQPADVNNFLLDGGNA